MLPLTASLFLPFQSNSALSIKEFPERKFFYNYIIFYSLATLYGTHFPENFFIILSWVLNGSGRKLLTDTLAYIWFGKSKGNQPNYYKGHHLLTFQLRQNCNQQGSFRKSSLFCRWTRRRRTWTCLCGRIHRFSPWTRWGAVLLSLTSKPLACALVSIRGLQRDVVYLSDQ